MFNMNQKNNLRKLIITSVCLIFGLVLSGLFVWQTTCVKDRTNNETLVVEQAGCDAVFTDSSFSVECGDFDKDKDIQLVSTTSTNGTGYSYTTNNVPATIPAGTRITAAWSFGKSYNINFDTDADGTRDGYATVSIDVGYSLSQINFGDDENSVRCYYNGGKHYIVDEDNATRTEVSYFTPEDIDPNYSGTLKFTVQVSPITYGVNLFYRNTSGTYDDDHKVIATYNVEAPINVANVSYTRPSANEEVVPTRWEFNLTKAQEMHDGKDYIVTLDDDSNPTQATVTMGTDVITFTFVSGVTPRKSGGGVYLALSEISGHGNFISEMEKQDPTDPIIVAYEASVYQIMIQNEGEYWPNITDENFTDAMRTNLYGIPFYPSYVMIGAKTDYDSNGVNADKTFMTGEGDAFKYKTDFSASEYRDAYGYAVFNYGHYLEKYKLSYQIQTGVDANGDPVYEEGLLYFNDSSEKWAIATSQSDYIDVNFITDNNYDLSYGTLAAFLDEKITTNYMPTLTLEPIWKPVKLNILIDDGDDVLVGDDDEVEFAEVTYGTEYSLSPAEDNNGQSFFSYIKNGRLIANEGVWNYFAICGYSDYGYDEESGEYSLSVSPFYLDDIYKITLNNAISLNNDDEFQMMKTDFEFALYGDEYSSARYTYKDLMGEITTYDKDENKLIDFYAVGEMVDYQSAYHEYIDGDGTDDHEIFKKVYYSNGTLSDGVLTASSPDFYIYLANNQAIGELPMFKNDYATLIAWSDVSNSYITAGYLVDFAKDLKGTESDGTWTNGEGKNQFSAIYVYAFDAYYEDNNSEDGKYSAQRIQWFGANTILKEWPSDQPENLPTGKTFSCWMINALAARDQGYEVTHYMSEDNIPYVQLSKTTIGVEIRFAYMDYSQYNDFEDHYNYYYSLNWISGTGILVQDDNNPIVLARLNGAYNLVIDNSSDEIYWADKNVDKSELYGAVSSAETSDDGEFAKTSMLISNDENSKYPFQTSTPDYGTGLSFYKQEDMSASVVNSKIDNNNYYYVYNYGHTIAGWEISCLETWFVYDGSNWTFSATPFPSGLDYLLEDEILFSDLAAVVADKFPAEAGNVEITIKPVWEKAVIHAYCAGKSTPVVFNFADEEETYSLPIAEDEDGKEFFCYSVNNKPVANEGVWDYTQISKVSYSYYPEGACYEIYPTPQYLDNVYKVTLGDTPVDAEIKNGTEYSKYDGNETFNQENYSYSDVDKLGGELLDISDLTMGDDISEALSEYISDYQDFIVGENSAVYRKVFGDGSNLYIYLANNSSVGILPTFVKDYKQEIFWTDALGNPYVAEEYDEDLYSAERNGKDLFDIWEYPNGLLFTPVYVYALDMFYETKTGDYATKDAAWFGLNTPLGDELNPIPTLSADDLARLPENKSFSSWMVNLDAATAKGYTISPSGNKITLSLADISIEFNFTEQYNNYYYGITAIKGTGVLSQNNNNPIVLARLTRNYNLTIDNSSDEIYWADKDVTKTNLYGAISSSENDADYTKTSMVVSDNANSAYPFQTTEQTDADGVYALSFYKNSQMSASVVNSKIDDNNYYYVYNYGHHITNWLIEINLVSSNTLKYVTYNGTTWSDVDANNPELYYVTPINVSGISFQTIANYLDNKYATEKGDIDITITPIWSEVTINVMNGETNVGTVPYASVYSLTEPTTINGQTFFCYADSKDYMLANSAVWNYLNIETYEYVSDGNYNLDVTAQYLDNVYKVTLKDTSVNTSVKNGGDYEANNDGATYNAEMYNHANMPDLTQPLATAEMSDDLSASLKTFFNGYINNVKNSPIYRQLFSYQSKYIYLINNSEVGTLPTFDYTHKQEVLWKDSSDNRYKAAVYADEFEAELNEKEFTTTWVVNNGVELTPAYVYRLELYYEDVNPEDGVYSTKDAAWFSLNFELSEPFLYSKFTETIPSESVFVGWMINAEMAQNVYGYTVVNDATNKTVTISPKDSTEKFSLTFKYEKVSDYNINYYYGVSSVQGYGEFTQSKVVDGVHQPIVLARYGRTYNLTIDNSNTYWKNKNVDDEELYGAYSSVGTSVGYAKTVMTIGNHQDYAYPFQTTEQTNADGTYGLSFYKKSDMSASVVNSKIDDSNYYYIYNYGHYIKAWNIKCSGVMFGYNENAPWSVKTDGTIIDNLVAVLEQVSFQDVAELMDDYFPLATGKPTITITPNWGRANIDVWYGEMDLVPVVSGNTTGTIGFGLDYTLDTKNISKSLEKELIAFEYNNQDGSDTDFIALSAVWNYYNKNNAITDIADKYTYSVAAVNGAGVYKLDVTPVFIDNIHKVNLTGVTKYAENTYQLENSDYEYFTKAGTYDNEGKNVLTFKDSFGSYSFVSFDNKVFGFADEYITKLIECKATYVDGIEDGELDILRKVYYSSGTLSNSTTLSATTSNFWIYLANGKQTGILPTFKNDYRTHIFWQNIAHNDSSNCVGVDSCVALKHYLYLAGTYDAELHEETIKSNEYLLHDEDNNSIPDSIWFLNDGHSGENVTLNAKYLRNYYYLEIETLVNEAIEKRGYVRIDVVDKLYEIDNTVTNRSGCYTVIAQINNVTNKMEMKVYHAETTDKPLSEQTLVAFNEVIRVYNGSDVTISIKDQSKDSTSMATGQYDEMIGYKFTGVVEQTVTQQETEEINVFTANGYVYSASVSNLGYKIASIIKLKVYFEKLNYELDVRIDNLKSGEFNVQLNNVYTGYRTYYNLTNMSVGNFYQVNYFAFAGYKLQNDAFMYNNNLTEQSLQSYDDITNTSQIYTFTGNLNEENNLDGKWLRENFYSSYTSYPIDLVHLGVLTIQTEVIVFNYGVVIYDETDTTAQVVNNKGIVETFDDGQFSLTYSTGVGTVNAVGDYLINTYGFWYYDSLSGVDYALLSSRMLIPQNPTTTNDNFYTTYKFLLTEYPTTQSVLTSSNLAFMVKSYEDGKIISLENRNLFIMLEVRKIYTLTMQVLVVENDTNDSARTTTLTNGNNNSKSIIINANKGSLSGYYYADDANLTTSVTTYTYHGLNNTLASVYNTNKYSEVRYYLNGAANNLEGNSFIVERNSTIDIEYIPNTLHVEYVYMLEGVDVIEEDVAPYINQTKPNVSEAGLKSGDVVEYSIENLNQDYDARVTINGNVMGTADKDSSIVNCSYTVSELDLALHRIEILVEIYPRSNAEIKINYTLIDSSKRDVDDDFGTFDVYVNEEVEVQEVNSVTVTVLEGRNVYISLNLNCGYHLVGIKKGAYGIKQVEADENGRILLVEDFNISVDDGDYLIVIDKDSISATLDTSSVKTKSFVAYMNGKLALNGLYVGSVVEFTYVDVTKERLDAFYCEYPDGSTQDIENNDGQIKFKITSEVLSKFNSNVVTFGVRTISRYSLTINVVGQEYLAEQVSISHNDGTDYENGTYCDAGTELIFSIIPIGVSEGKYKYDILFNGNTYEVINKDDIVIVLDQDYVHTITITPKTFNVIVSENVYTNLGQIENGTPDSVTTNQVNNLNIQGQTNYYSMTTLEFTRVARKANGSLDRELSSIRIADNDSDKVIVIEFDGTVYNATVDGVEVELADFNYSITVNNRTVKLTYVTLNNISITLDYKDYKTISAG